jgi:arsenite methyltransferase
MIDTGDARSMPYPNATFDVVASMTAVHNIPGKRGKQAAIAEMWRVTKPASQVLIFYIRHARSYLSELRETGATDAKLAHPASGGCSDGDFPFGDRSSKAAI